MLPGWSVHNSLWSGCRVRANCGHILSSFTTRETREPQTAWIGIPDARHNHGTVIRQTATTTNRVGRQLGGTSVARRNGMPVQDRLGGLRRQQAEGEETHSATPFNYSSVPWKGDPSIFWV